MPEMEELALNLRSAVRGLLQSIPVAAAARNLEPGGPLEIELIGAKGGRQANAFPVARRRERNLLYWRHGPLMGRRSRARSVGPVACLEFAELRRFLAKLRQLRSGASSNTTPVSGITPTM